jgi:predicted DNA-binding protein (MmcQ/YjbR family)
MGMAVQTPLRMMREVCLSLPETVEGEHFGEACFRVGKRIFATCGEKHGVCRIVFQLKPVHARRLVASDPRFQPYARQKDGVWIDAADVEEWDEVRALVLESYQLNKVDARPSKKGQPPARRKRTRR